MSLAFNRRIKRPSFAQLNQNNIYINRFILQKGNPYLLKEDIYEINYNLMYKFISIRSNYIYKKDPIHIYINSPGGSVVDGLAIYDISKIIEAPIRTICIGLAASMGAVLMLMGNERCALKHSRLMFHEVSGGAVGKLSDLKIQFKLAEDLQKDIYAIIKDKTQLENIDIILEKDNWFTSEEALNYKIINKIL